MNSLLKSSAIYTATNIVNRLMPFLLLPFLTRVLNEQEYGIISMAEVFIAIMLPLVSVNSYGAISRRFFEYDTKFGRYISTALFINLITTGLIMILFYFFSNHLESFLGIPYYWINICLIIVLFKSGLQTTLTVYQVNEKPVVYSIFQLSNTLINVLMSIWLILILNFSWDGRLLAQLISFIIFGLVGIYFIQRLHNFEKPNKGDTEDILKFGLPLIPHALGGMLITMSDRIILTNMTTLEVTGVYAAGAQIGMVIWMIQDAFNKAWIPFLFKKMKDNSSQDKMDIVKITYVYFIVILILAAILSIFAKFITDILLGDGFKEAYIFIPFIAFGFAFNGMYKMVSGPLFYLKKTKYLSFVTALTAIINIILTIIFIKVFGPIGAAISTCLAFLIGFIIIWFISNKYYSLNWKMRKEV